MRSLTLAAAFLIAASAVASAQQNAMPQNPATGVPDAPVGHRQPTAADVPGNDSAKGGSPAGAPAGGAPARSDNDRKVDKMINVCPSC